MLIELTIEQEQALLLMASQTEQSPQQFAEGLLTRALEHEQASRALLAQAEADIASNQVLSHLEVENRLSQRFHW